MLLYSWSGYQAVGMRLALLLLACLVALTATAPAGAHPESHGYLRLRFGQSADFYDIGTGARLRVTVVSFHDPLRSPVYRPPRGRRFVGFYLRIKLLSAVGALAAVTPDSFVDLIDTTGRSYPGYAFSWPLARPDLTGGIKLRPVQTVSGYLTYILPSQLRLRWFSFSDGSTIAAWRLPS
jgi:hypothetical protein